MSDLLTIGTTLCYFSVLLQGRRKTFRGGAATSKKHGFGREAAEKLISALHRYPHIYIHGKYGGIDQACSRKHRPVEAKLDCSGLPILVPECVQLA